MGWLKKIRYWWGERELRNPKSWDWEHAEMHEPSPPERRYAVVSVRMKSAEFQRIAKAARERGKPTSTFIKESALAMCGNPATSVSGADEQNWTVSGLRVDSTS